MKRKRVLLTGFEPFSDLAINESSEIVDMISNVDMGNIEITTKILSVDQRGTVESLDILKKGKFDAVLHLGLSRNSEKVRLERFATNIISMQSPDNSGRLIKKSKIIENFSDRIETTVSIHNFDEEFEDDPDVKWSDSAGSYVCNETYYRTLAKFSHSKVPILFVHLPKMTEIPLSRQSEIVLRSIRIMVTRPKMIVVGAMIRNQKGSILACMRPKGDAWSGWWEFPGGKVEGEESLKDALSREIEEELGLPIMPRSKVCEINHRYQDRDVNLHIFDCGIVDNDEIVLMEHDESRWLSQDELLDVKWLPADFPTIESWHREGIPIPKTS
jgi:mutator protein MutT|tara:strand:- start:27944 stop:28930 length:987 start_codon:yes stop_codon:yes gene_type:complete